MRTGAYRKAIFQQDGVVLKSKVYNNNKPNTIDDLKRKVVHVYSEITQKEIQNADNHTFRRLDHLLDKNGGIFEHLLQLSNPQISAQLL